MSYKNRELFSKFPDRFSVLNRQKGKQIKMSNLKNKVAAVFAASGAIASAVAQSFARHGAKVYVSGRDLKKVQALAAWQARPEPGWQWPEALSRWWAGNHRWETGSMRSRGFVYFYPNLCQQCYLYHPLYGFLL